MIWGGEARRSQPNQPRGGDEGCSPKRQKKKETTARERERGRERRKAAASCASTSPRRRGPSRRGSRAAFPPGHRAGRAPDGSGGEGRGERRGMAGKKRKAEAARLEETDRALYGAFRGAANSLSQLYTLAMGAQKASFHAGERHAMVRANGYPTRSGVSSPLSPSAADSGVWAPSPGGAGGRDLCPGGGEFVPAPSLGVSERLRICEFLARLVGDFRANASSAAGRLDS
jgi:hypothetical protein